MAEGRSTKGSAQQPSPVIFVDQNMGVAETLIVWTLKTLTLVYDVLTLPFYAIAQKPWVRLRDDKEPKAQSISHEHGITYRSLIPISSMHIELERGKVDTMEKVFAYAVKRNGNKKCLGTREILDEEDEVQPNKRVFKKLVLGNYIWKTYPEVETLVLLFSKGLLELGLKPTDKVVLFAETRAEWLIAAFAAYKQNLSIVTLYATLGDDAIIHGLNETEATHIITSHELLPKFQHILPVTKSVTNIIYMEDSLKKTETSGYGDVTITAFCDVVKLGNESKHGTTPPTPNDIAIIMYTSGSTGVPKGVLLTHNNIATAMLAFSDAIGVVYPNDVIMAFLPLAHVLEFICESINFLSGIPIGYSTPLTMTDTSSKIKRGCKGDASILQPTIMASVPLILDRVYKGIFDKVQAGGVVSQAMFKFFYQYKLKWYKRGYRCPMVDKVIFGKIKSLLGGRVRLLATGGAPLAPETQEFIRTCLSCPLLQGYGLTETVACATVAVASDMSVGRVGGPLSCCDIRLESWEEGNYRVTDKPFPRGEVIVGGDNVSIGYYKLPDKTDEDFFVEGGRRWFRTGDIAEIHNDGCLKIIDRKKDLVKLQFGEYVSLGKVESEMKTCPIVDNICIYGDPTKMFVVALLIPSPKHLQGIAEKIGKNGLSFDAMCKDADVKKAVLKDLQDHGKKCKLAKFEIPEAITLVSDAWTPDTELVTAAFKLKRKNIQDKYQADIDRMYSKK